MNLMNSMRCQKLWNPSDATLFGVVSPPKVFVSIAGGDDRDLYVVVVFVAVVATWRRVEVLG
jgi:hypothetical protein